MHVHNFCVCIWNDAVFLSGSLLIETGSLQVPQSHCVSSTRSRYGESLSIWLNSGAFFPRLSFLDRRFRNTGSTQLYRFLFFIAQLKAQSGFIEFAEIPSKLIFERAKLKRSYQEKRKYQNLIEANKIKRRSMKYQIQQILTINSFNSKKKSPDRVQFSCKLSVC